MTTMYNQASLDYRRVLMPQQQYQAALAKGMPPQQAMKAAYPSGNPGGTQGLGKASAVSAPRPGAVGGMRGQQGQQGQAKQQLMVMVDRVAQMAKQLGPDAIAEAKQRFESAIGAGAGVAGAGVAGAGARRGAGAVAQGIPRPPVGGASPMGGAPQMGGGIRPPGVPQRRQPGMM